MALEHDTQQVSNTARAADFKRRHYTIGANVAVSVLAATAIVVVLQWGSYYASGQYDLTESGVNSLSPGTERLLEGLDEKVRLTSLYFQTDLEEDDQSKYRTKINDLLNLYQSTNRSQVEVNFINPLKDFGPRQELLTACRTLNASRRKPHPARNSSPNCVTRRSAASTTSCSSRPRRCPGFRPVWPTMPSKATWARFKP